MFKSCYLDSPQAAAITHRAAVSRTVKYPSSSVIARRSHSNACAKSVHFWAGRNVAVCRHSEAMVRYRRTFSKMAFALIEVLPFASGLCIWRFAKSLAGSAERPHGLRTGDLLHEPGDNR